VCFDVPMTTTRLLMTCDNESKFLLVRDEDQDRWELPGGEGWEEEDGVGWDVGARIGALQDLVKTQLGLDVPWMSYIEDVERDGGICRLYGFSGENVVVENGSAKWFTKDQVQSLVGAEDYICGAIETWLREDIVRGKGTAVGQRKVQFE
jgi:hypothetical protein